MSATPSTPDDGSRVSAHFLNPLLKNSGALQFEAAPTVSATLDKKAKEAAIAYLQELTVSRSNFISKLDSSAANTDAELDEAASTYLSLLLGLVNNYAEASTTTDLDQETGESCSMQGTLWTQDDTQPWTQSQLLSPADTRLQALLGAGPRRVQASDEFAIVSQQMQGNAPGRRCLLFQWQDVLVTTAPSSAADTVFELASALIAASLWKQRRAVYLCQGGKQGTISDAAIKV